MDRLIVIRHGETAWNAGKVLQGQQDIELSERGRAQALALGKLISEWSVDSVVCSDLLRARQTAAALGWANAEPDALWREASLGDWTGRKATELKQLDPEHYQGWRDGLRAPPGGESFKELRTRVAHALRKISDRKGVVAVVTHGGTIRALLSELIGLDPSNITAVEPASATVFDFTPRPRLHVMNMYAQLKRTETTE